MERTTRFILGQALANWARASSIPVTHPGKAGSDIPYMSLWNTLVREFDTFRPMLGVPKSHVQHASVLLSVPAFTTTHTTQEEIEQTYGGVPQATLFYKQNLLQKGSKRYGKHSLEVGSSALEPGSQTPRDEPLGDPSLVPYVNLSKSTSRMAEPDQMAHATQRDETILMK